MIKKKVLIDIEVLFSSSEKTGIHRYVSELVSHIKSLHEKNEVFDIDLFLGKEVISLKDYNEKMIHQICSSAQETNQMLSTLDPFLLKLIKEKVFERVPLLYKLIPAVPVFHFIMKLKNKVAKNIKNRYDLVHLTAPDYYYALKDFKGNKIVTIHDLTVHTTPECHEKGTIENIKRSYRYVQKKASHIITDSQSTKDDFLKYYTYSKNKITPTYLGYNKKYFYPIHDQKIIEKTKQKYNIMGDYILNLNTMEPRKNVIGCMKAFNQLKNSNSNINLKLVLIGKIAWKAQNILKEIKKNEKYILFTGFVADEDLAPLYNGALFFCYPSFYEGFGLPLLESMACGTPVIYGNNSSMPEVAAECGLGVNAADINDIHEKMKELYFNEDLRNKLKSKCIPYANQFSWKKCAREILELYKTVLENESYHKGEK